MISIEKIRIHALSLPDKERAGLAHALLLSLGNDSEGAVIMPVAYPNEYEHEIERRSQGYEQGKMSAVSKDVFINRMQKRNR